MDKREGATKIKVAGRGALLFMYPLHIACFYYFNCLGFVLSLSKGGGGHAGNTGVFEGWGTARPMINKLRCTLFCSIGCN